MKSKYSKDAMLIHEDKNSVCYRTQCSCGSPDCDIILDFSRDTGVSLIFYKGLRYADWESNGIKKVWKRFLAACSLLFTGHLQVKEEFLLQGPEQVDNFIHLLQEGRGFCEDTNADVNSPCS
jgi:hypothetical protein